MVPAVSPLRVPLVAPMVATAGVLLAQVPPAGVPLMLRVAPSHTCGADGLTALGCGFTSITVVRAQPVGRV